MQARRALRSGLPAALGLAVVGCAQAPPYQPAVDLAGADAARYQADLADCRRAADLDQYGPVLAGVVVGAGVGAGLGNVAGWLFADNVGLATSYGALSGAVAGGGAGLALSTPHHDRPAIDDCLRANGYKVTN